MMKPREKHGRFLPKFKRGKLANLAVYIVLILISYQFLYPILKMLTTALMGPADIINPAVQWIPKSLTFKNVTVAASVLDLWRTLWNSLWFTGLLAIGQTLVSALTGFAFARFDVKFKGFWFVMVLLTFIIPIPILLISRMMMFQSWQNAMEGVQLIGTTTPQLLMSVLGQGPYSAVLILIFYNFTRMIPRSLDEAASIDGANSIQIFYHVVLKLSLTTLLVVFLFSFVWNWNESYQTMTFLRDRVALLPRQLNNFASLFSSMQSSSAAAGEATNRINEAYRMSGTLLSILPLIAIYLLVQKQFISGIENAGITGE